MGQLVDFEKRVIRLLARSALDEGQLEAVIEETTEMQFEYTGSGYFMTLVHPILPKQRIVCSDPVIQGVAGNITCGFVIFIEDGTLTLECHTMGPVDVPPGFRTMDVQI